VGNSHLAGLIKTSTGSYLGVFPYVLVLALVGIVISFTLLRPPQAPIDKI